MSISRLVLDAYPLMVLFEKEKGFEQVEALLRDAIKEHKTFILSEINWGEIYYSLYRAQGEKAAEEALMIIDQLPIELYPVDRACVYQAAQFKAKYPIAYGDCFAAAVAMKENLPVLTGDKHFELLKECITIKWI